MGAVGSILGQAALNAATPENLSNALHRVNRMYNTAFAAGRSRQHLARRDGIARRRRNYAPRRGAGTQTVSRRRYVTRGTLSAVIVTGKQR